MGFIIGLMTVVLTLNCMFLILLILIQLPKKEAGVGTAFGGSATDALFGAGTGNALTKMTKYSATLFFGLSLLLSIISANANRDIVHSRVHKQTGVPAATPAPPRSAPSALPEAPNKGASALPPLVLPSNAPAAKAEVQTNASPMLITTSLVTSSASPSPAVRTNSAVPAAPNPVTLPPSSAKPASPVGASKASPPGTNPPAKPAK